MAREEKERNNNNNNKERKKEQSRGASCRCSRICCDKSLFLFLLVNCFPIDLHSNRHSHKSKHQRRSFDHSTIPLQNDRHWDMSIFLFHLLFIFV